SRSSTPSLPRQSHCHPAQFDPQDLLPEAPQRRKTRQSRSECRRSKARRSSQLRTKKPKTMPCELNTVAGLDDGTPMAFYAASVERFATRNCRWLQNWRMQLRLSQARVAGTEGEPSPSPSLKSTPS